jgi:heparosan-N-sulfate-glucuronate 5-epimerase
LKKLQYWNRIFKAYILGNTSHLSFWHGEPRINPDIVTESLGPYYMLFHKKAEFVGHSDVNGIPMLDYQGTIGLQYNPIAIAQWGLGNYNIWYETESQDHFNKFIKCANWLVENLEENSYGLKVWMHYFDFEYRDTLKAPWYSGLAQGQGISVLIRAYKETNNEKYKNAADQAFQVFNISTVDGGVNFKDANGNNWIEEYIVHPPTHILNGFIWGLWGVYDYAIQFNDKNAQDLFKDYNKTLIQELDNYDNGFWSLYEHSGTWLKMIASLFYHKLHIVQLRVMYHLTSVNKYSEVANNWTNYLNSTFNRKRALLQKAIFKVLYY